MNAVIEKPAALVATSEATKLKNKLRDMANQAGAKAHERIGLARQLLTDKDWIAAEHAGDSHAALETIEADFFGDLCGSVPLARLLKMHEVVQEDDWRRHKFNLQRVASAYQEKIQQTKGAREPAKRATIEQVQKLEEDVEHFRTVAKSKETEVKQVTTRVQQLERELAEEKRENAHLRGRVEELERMIDRLGVRQSA